MTERQRGDGPGVAQQPVLLCRRRRALLDLLKVVEGQSAVLGAARGQSPVLEAEHGRQLEPRPQGLRAVELEDGLEGAEGVLHAEEVGAGGHGSQEAWRAGANPGTRAVLVAVDNFVAVPH